VDKKVLIVDDNPEHRELTGRVLAARGYEVWTAEDAETGLQMAVARRPDLILLDLGLPDVDGQTLVGLLRQVPHLSDTPIIAVTAWPQETAREMVGAYGCTGFISKPIIRISDFANQIAAYLR